MVEPHPGCYEIGVLQKSERHSLQAGQVRVHQGLASCLSFYQLPRLYLVWFLCRFPVASR